jgi:hypothetical protein
LTIKCHRRKIVSSIWVLTKFYRIETTTTVVLICRIIAPDEPSNNMVVSFSAINCVVAASRYSSVVAIQQTQLHVFAVPFSIAEVKEVRLSGVVAPP